MAVVVATFALMFGGPALAAGPIYSVMNTSETPPDGVWFRDNPSVSGPRLNGYGVYRGDRVELRCYGWGESIGAYANRLWYYSANVTRTSAPGRANVGWLNAHYVNDNQNANVVAPGVPACGAPPTSGGGSGGGGASAPAPSPVRMAFGRPCTPVTLIVMRGTGETSPGVAIDRPLGVMKKITDRLNFSQSELRVHYVGYPASFNYIPSKNEGYRNARGTIAEYARQCDTRFILAGYSQGAQVLGDLTGEIGKQSTPIAPSRLLGTYLLADPERDARFRPAIGIQGGGHGVFGPRTGSFGSASSKVVEYCMARDPICDNGGSFTSVPRAVSEMTRPGPHTSYASTLVPGSNDTFTERMATQIRWRIYLRQ